MGTNVERTNHDFAAKISFFFAAIFFFDFAAKPEKEKEQFDAATLPTCLLRKLKFTATESKILIKFCPRVI